MNDKWHRLFLASEHISLLLPFSQGVMDISEKWITGSVKRLIMKFQPVLRISVILKPIAAWCRKASSSHLGLQLIALGTIQAGVSHLKILFSISFLCKVDTISLCRSYIFLKMQVRWGRKILSLLQKEWQFTIEDYDEAFKTQIHFCREKELKIKDNCPLKQML